MIKKNRNAKKLISRRSLQKWINIQKWKIKYDSRRSLRKRIGEVIKWKYKIKRNLRSDDDVNAIKIKKAKSKSVEVDEAKIRSEDIKGKNANFCVKIDIAKKDGKIRFFRKFSESESKYKMNYSALSERKECVGEHII